MTTSNLYTSIIPSNTLLEQQSIKVVHYQSKESSKIKMIDRITLEEIKSFFQKENDEVCLVEREE